MINFKTVSVNLGRGFQFCGFGLALFDCTSTSTYVPSLCAYSKSLDNHSVGCWLCCELLAAMQSAVCGDAQLE